MKSLIETLPKAELHLHIEGTFEPEQMFEIAARNNVLGSLPFNDLAAAKLAYKFEDLQSFLNIYYAGCAVLLHEKDFYDLTMAYLERAAADKVVYVEIMFDPQTHTERGVAFETVLRGISGALKDAGPKLGITGSLMMSFLRHLGPEAAFGVLKEAEPFKSDILSVGLDSTELGWPPTLWEEAYKQAASQGYRLSAHAGEEGPADYIWQALKALKVERIDHGVHCIEDLELVDHLRKNNIALTVCPLSNLKLKVFEGELEEKMRELLSHNLLITINADDPAYFGGYENANFQYLADKVGVNAEGIYRYCCNGFRAAFISDEQKWAYIAKVDAAFSEVMGAKALEAAKSQ